MPKLSVWASLILTATMPYAFGQSDPNNLNHITQFASLIFMQRNGNCISGRVKSADASTITVESYVTPDKKASVTISRNDLRFVGEAATAHNVLFSSRSSWQDVREANPRGPQESLRLTLKNGKHESGKPVHIDDDSLELNRLTGHAVFQKSDIATVD